jgi:hypothetical protein
MALHPARSAQLLSDLGHTAINEELCPRDVTRSSEARKDTALAGLVSIPEPPERDRSCKRLFQSTPVVRLGDEDRLAFFAWRCGCVRTQISSQRLPHCPRHLSSLVSSSITPPHSGQMQFRIADLTSSAWVVRVSNILLLSFTKGPVKRSLIASLLSVAHRRPLEFVIKSGADPLSFQVFVYSIRRIQRGRWRHRVSR